MGGPRLCGEGARARTGEVTAGKSLVVLTGKAWKVPLFLRTALPIAATGGIAIVYERIDLLMLEARQHPGGCLYGVALYGARGLGDPPEHHRAGVLSAAAVAGLKDAPDLARESFFLLWRLFLLMSAPIASSWLSARRSGDGCARGSLRAREHR